MTLYAAGDLQGCAGPFERLLEQLRFDPDHDHLWLVGDLVNRGPESLQVLRRVIALGDSVTTVLGNHDLHLLAVAAGARQPGQRDTLDDILAAPDRDELLNWMRNRALIRHDSRHRLVLTHAGIPPDWSVEHALAMAGEVQDLLRSDDWRAQIGELFGNLPDREQDATSAIARARYTVNALTRMRCCDRNGRLDFGYTGPPQSRPPTLTPWYDMPQRKAADWHLVFGHWAALGVLRRENLTALDSGCVWGGQLSAAALLPPGPVVAIPCRS